MHKTIQKPTPDKCETLQHLPSHPGPEFSKRPGTWGQGTNKSGSVTKIGNCGVKRFAVSTIDTRAILNS